MGFLFGGFDIMFLIIFTLVVGYFIFVFARGITQWGKNNNSPRLTVNATVVAKRPRVSHYRHGNAGDITGAHGYHNMTSTTYFATFQVESGDRIELCVSGSEYGMLAEGDFGKLSFQGTRYLGFERL